MKRENKKYLSAVERQLTVLAFREENQTLARAG